MIGIPPKIIANCRAANNLFTTYVFDLGRCSVRWKLFLAEWWFPQNRLQRTTKTRTGQPGQDSREGTACQGNQGMTAGTEQPGHDWQGRTARKGQSGQIRQERTAGKKNSQDKTGRTGRPAKRTARTGPAGEDSRKPTARTGSAGQDSQARAELPELDSQTLQPEKDS